MPTDFPRHSTFLPFLPISIPPNLHHYLSLPTSRVPSFTSNHNSLPPSLPLHACRLHVARGLTSHLILGFGVGKVAFFQNHILYTKRMHQPPQTLPGSTAGCSPHILHTKPTVSIHQPGPQSFSPGHLNTEKKNSGACSCSRERDGFHTQPQPPTGQAAQTTASHPTQTLHKFTQNTTHSKAPPYLTHTELRPP